MGRRSNYQNGLYKQLMDVTARFEQFRKSTMAEISSLRARLDDRDKEIERLTHENTLLKNENERLRSNAANNSGNSSIPPSKDQKPSKPPNTYNGRVKTGRKPGAQPGHKGTTLTKKSIIAKIAAGELTPEVVDIGERSRKFISKFVVDAKLQLEVKEIRIHADENGKFNIPAELRSDVTYGPELKAMAACLYCEGSMPIRKISRFLNSASRGALCLSDGTVYGFMRRLADIGAPSITTITDGLLSEAIVLTDSTNVTVAGVQAYVRNFSSEFWALFVPMAKKNLAALHSIDFLENYAGILVHDHETALYHFGTGHAECNVHVLRYLQKNSEEAGNSWSRDLSSFLCSVNKCRKTQKDLGKTQFPDEQVRMYEAIYDAILSDGWRQNSDTRGKLARSEEKSLLIRLSKYTDEHLFFLNDFRVPFDNNMSERDLRKCKNRQKISGGFRKPSGHQIWCNIMSIVETCKRRGMQVMDAIASLFRSGCDLFASPNCWA